MELAEFLQAIRTSAGRPPIRLIAKEIHFSHTTVGDILKARNGNWVAIERVLKFLCADDDAIHKARTLWLAANTDWNKRPTKEYSPPWAEKLLAAQTETNELLRELIETLKTYPVATCVSTGKR